MDFSVILNSMQGALGDTVPNILAAVAILIIGWIVAVIFRAVTRKGMNLLGANDRFGKRSDGSVMNIESGVAKGVFWLIMLIVLIAFFDTLKLPGVAEPLQGLVNKVFEFIPNLVAGGILALVAWIIATIVRMFATKALAATTLDDKLSAEADMPPLSANLGNIFYWLILLLFLPAILGALGLDGLLEPVQGMVDKILAMLPNIFAAAVIGFVGYFVANILRDIVQNLLAAVKFDQFGERAGLKGNVTPSKLVGTLVFVFVFVPALIAALNALKIDAISAPATDMLNTFMAAIPNIFAAAVILGIAYVLARFISGLLDSLLDGFGFNNVPAKMGFADITSEGFVLSKLAAKIVSFFIMLFAFVEASNRLGFGQVADLVGTFIEFGSQVLLGGAILAIGYWLANIAHSSILKFSGEQSTGLATIVRFAILGLVTAMGLGAMGIADNIVNMAFALTLGAVAVAFALSFGLGGREAAGKQMEHWLSKMRRD